MNIYTKTGDNGMTSLMKIKNVSKSDDRIELLGTIDELTCHLGLIKTETKAPDSAAMLQKIQKTLMTIMAGIADPYNKDYKLPVEEVTVLEEEINRLESLFPRKKEFILPGECKDSAQIDVARTVARRAERRLITADKKYGGDQTVKKYMNRLADYLYLSARYADYAKENKENSELSFRSDADKTTASPIRPEENRGVQMSSDEVIRAVLQKIGQPERIGLQAAKKLIERIEEYCKISGLNSVISVCGPDGNIIAVHVMDGAFLVSFDISTKKAYTAVAVKMSTMELSKLAQPGQTFYGVDKTDNGKIIIFGGGIPLTYGGRIIGGLGVSGGTGEQDHAAAEYGLSVLDEVMRELC